jgi:outer membrane lipoprotein-sorting protein
MKHPARVEVQSLLVSVSIMLILWCTSAEALDIDQLMKQLSSTTYNTVHFTERKYLHSLSKPLELSGLLKYEAPDHFVKETLQPRPETMTIDGGTLTIERGGKSRTLQLQDYPMMQAFIECIRGTMRGDLSGLSQYYNLDLSGDQQHWQITLLPKDTRLQKVIQTILISGNANHIDVVEIRQAKGDRSVMNIVRE